jgi:hypothetical protein
MDYGYPQFTEANILSEYIKTDAYRMEVGRAGCCGRCRGRRWAWGLEWERV